jgi:hypothetical protein
MAAGFFFPGVVLFESLSRQGNDLKDLKAVVARGEGVTAPVWSALMMIEMKLKKERGLTMRRIWMSRGGVDIESGGAHKRTLRFTAGHIFKPPPPPPRQACSLIMGGCFSSDERVTGAGTTLNLEH